MKTPDARVLIVDDDRGKANDLTAMIEGAGGMVVGHIDDFEAAVEEFGSRNFPTHPDQRNVVLLDGSMQRGSHTDGSRLFSYGRERGWLHGTTERAPGVLALSCSIDTYSSVSHDTGATVSERDPASWEKILDGHLAVPQFAPDEAIERALLDGFEIGQALHIALGGQAIRNLAVLRLAAPSEGVDNAKILELAEPELTALASPQSLMQAMSGRGGPKTVKNYAKYPAFSATAALTTDSGLVVVTREQHPNPYYDGTILTDPMLTNCKFDRIPFPTLAEIPTLYWADHQLDPSMFVQN